MEKSDPTEVWFFEILFKHDGSRPYPELDAGGGGYSSHALLGVFNLHKIYFSLRGVLQTPTHPLTLVKPIIQKVSFL